METERVGGKATQTETDTKANAIQKSRAVVALGSFPSGLHFLVCISGLHFSEGKLAALFLLEAVESWFEVQS